MSMANAIQITSKLYECRDAARRMLGEKYHERIGAYERVIRGVAAERVIGLLEAGKIVAEAAGGGMTSVLVLAATVEAIEPSNSK